MTSPLNWTHAISAIGDSAIAENRRATAAERTALAAALDVISCDDLTARYDIRPLGRGRFRLTAEIEAEITQACVVTLDPVAARITERLSAEFRPEEDAGLEADGGERGVLAGDDIEPIHDGLIDAGRLVFELLSAAIDPYPRAPDAEFQWQDPMAGDDAESRGPFAALARLKRPQ